MDFPHEASFSVGSEEKYVLLEFFGRQVQLQPAPFGAMIFASDFPSEIDAKSFGDRLRVACQLLSVRKAIPIFVDREPEPIFELHDFLESPAEDARKVDGMALQMSYTIIPEHQVILNYGELRGNLTRLVPADYFSEAFKEVEQRGASERLVFSDALDTACSFWSIACTRQSDIVRTVNIVAALEVLAAGAGIKATRERAVRELLEMEWSILQCRIGDLPQGLSLRSFCKELFRRRNEFVHTGQSKNTSHEVSRAAEEICKALILEGVAKSYFEES